MKKIKPDPYKVESEKNNKSKDLDATYFTPARTIKKQTITKDFLFSDFKKISDKAPFTIAEWAMILHISERTLHRYAHENAAFNGMQIERILLTEKLIDMGNSLFGKAGFKLWIHSSVFSLDNKSPKDFLNSYSGIQEVINVIGRIQHGIPS